ncbi:hypothetical protein GALL_40970 [mine drainage metagenome]|uniref:Uncharacterized protein n=1 Tax=mine drainage metagenome TaxID=410659 RepID=A0A1J5T4B6_9ZZZZ
MRTLVLLLAFAPLLHANALDALRARLAGLQRPQPVRAVVQYTFSSRQGDGARVERGSASAVAELGPSGLTVFWGREVLGRAAAELQAHDRNPEIQTPVRHILQALDAGRIDEYFNAAASLGRRLEDASLTGDAAATFEGRPARLLTLKLEPRLSAQDRKYVKQADLVARVWIDGQGIPLAAETDLTVKGRALLVITFQTTERDRYRFRVTGGRLLVVRHERDSDGSGGGERGQRSSVTELTYEPMGTPRRAQ